MDDNTAIIIAIASIFGWIPILAIGSVIRGSIQAITCNKCTCHNCKKENQEE